jgi:hypothetical protein
MIEDVTTALQAFASTGNGFTLTLRDARFLTFKVQGNGPVTAGQLTFECCPQKTPMTDSPTSGTGTTWTALTTITVPANSAVDYFAGSVSGTFRARISTPVTGETVTILAIRPEEQKVAIRPEEQKGWSRRPS